MRWIITTCMLLAYVAAQAQCCSGGVPISGNLGMAQVDRETFQANVNYDFNRLNDFKEGGNNLNDDSRSRTTQSMILEMGYAITNKIAIDLMASWVKQEREIQTNTSTNYTSTSGIGDLILLAKYSPLNNLQLGAGVKLPTGSSSRTNERGIPLNADLQPGSGSVDQITYANFTHTFNYRPTQTLGITSFYRFTGENDEYLSNATYEFGNEFTLIASLSDQLVTFNTIVSPSLRLRYRISGRDQFNGNDFPSSGGQFVFINPVLTIQISPELAMAGSYEIPVYAYVNEAQLTPTYRFNVGLYLVLAQNKTF